MPYPDDPSLRAGAIALLGSAWTSVPRGIERARSWGADWFHGSTPFFVRDGGGVPIGHVGVLEIPLRVRGRDLVVAGVHAVCVHPDHRGRGHLRSAMRDALAWVDARYETAVLWSHEPEIYPRFGFVRCEEHVFASTVDLPRAGGRARALSMASPDDRHLLSDRLARRAPISDRCGARDPGWLFLIDLALWPAALEMLWHVPPLDCVAVCASRDGVLRLYDVLAPSPPPLGELLAHLAAGERRVEVHLTPERLGGEGLSPSPHPSPDLLMVRGRPLDVDAPFSLSTFSRC